jgi:hypothetical protein
MSSNRDPNEPAFDGLVVWSQFPTHIVCDGAFQHTLPGNRRAQHPTQFDETTCDFSVSDSDAVDESSSLRTVRLTLVTDAFSRKVLAMDWHYLDVD